MTNEYCNRNNTIANTSVSDRLILLAKELGFDNVNKFEIASELPTGYVRKAKVITKPRQMQLQSLYPSVNMKWLLSGDGEMFTNKPNTEPTTKATEEETRPRIPLTVAAGVLSGSSDGVLLYECEQVPIIKAFPPYEYTMIIKGDSMEPKYEGGDEIAIRRVQGMIEWGRPYVLNTRDGVVLKRLYDAGDKFRCVSYNPEYPDFEVLKSDVFGVYKVVGLIRI